MLGKFPISLHLREKTKGAHRAT